MNYNSALTPSDSPSFATQAAKIEQDLLEDPSLRVAADTLAFLAGAEDWPEDDDVYWGPAIPNRWVHVIDEAFEPGEQELEYQVGGWTVGVVYRLDNEVAADTFWCHGHGPGDTTLHNPAGEPLTIEDARLLVEEACRLVDF